MRDGEMLKALAVHSGGPESRSPAPTTGVHTCDSSSRMGAGEGRSSDLPNLFQSSPLGSSEFSDRLY